MSQIDKIKSHNTTLRFWLGFILTVIIATISALISDYRSDTPINEITVLGVLTIITGVLLAGIIQHFINKNSDKLGEL